MPAGFSDPTRARGLGSARHGKIDETGGQRPPAKAHGQATGARPNLNGHRAHVTGNENGKIYHFQVFEVFLSD